MHVFGDLKPFLLGRLLHEVNFMYKKNVYNLYINEQGLLFHLEMFEKTVILILRMLYFLKYFN